MLESFDREPGLFEFAGLEIANPVHDRRNHPACNFLFRLFIDKNGHLYLPCLAFFDDSDFRGCSNSVLAPFRMNHNEYLSSWFLDRKQCFYAIFVGVYSRNFGYGLEVGIVIDAASRTIWFA